MVHGLVIQANRFRADSNPDAGCAAGPAVRRDNRLLGLRLRGWNFFAWMESMDNP